MENKEELNRIESLKERLSTGFSISRIPKKEKEWFINFSKDEFCDDRGMALKHIIDFYCGLIPVGIEHLEIAIQDLNDRLSKMENNINDSDNNNTVSVKKMANGKIKE